MAGTVHVHSARRPLADSPGCSCMPVPPTTIRWSTLRIDRQELALARPLLGEEEEVVWLGQSPQQRKWLEEVCLGLHHDTSAERDDPAFLALADLSPAEVNIAGPDTSELASADSEI
ncbi:MAG TPA: hypothetical protein VFJ60_03840 [Gaiella sp.]|nr:hypothetical protein [Gaiella sp.]